jgi:hypothetical protein
MFTQGTRRLLSQAGKRLRFFAEFATWGRCWWTQALEAIAWPSMIEHDEQPYECDQRELVEEKM